ncbi:MAG: M23 family metallopeptidase [Spirochaetaceae bacterium]|nr:MAG: M23 family metallopeptidase [Spirochaetaceae bacterium]
MVTAIENQKVNNRRARKATPRSRQRQLPGYSELSLSATVAAYNSAASAGRLHTAKNRASFGAETVWRAVADVSAATLEILSALLRFITAGYHVVHTPVYAAMVVSFTIFGFLYAPLDARVSELHRLPAVVLPEAGTNADTVFASLVPNRADMDEPVDVDISRFQRLSVREYTVARGDTLSGIALRNNIRVETLISFNGITDARRVPAGRVLRIPSADGVVHTVRRGESLSALSARYGTTVNALLDANDLASAVIAPGQTLFVPGGRMNPTELKIILGELFRYPTVGRFTSGFGMRVDPFTGLRRFHNGIDLANTPGTPVVAASSGRIAHVETRNPTYGKFVIMQHAGGFQTLYAHLDTISVSVGQTVSQGARVGLMGNSGRSTGPHLHFSVIKDGVFVDPLRYLP